MEPRLPSTCPNCRGQELYTRRQSTSHVPLLNGLGGFLHFAHMDVVLCSSCGHCMLFADEEATAKVKTESDWRSLNAR
jgi:hypothetical protein